MKRKKPVTFVTGFFIGRLCILHPVTYYPKIIKSLYLFYFELLQINIVDEILFTDYYS